MVQEVLLDVREMVPPEPLEKALAAIDDLGLGRYLCLIHRREPCALLPRLPNLNCAYWIACDKDGRCEVYIWREGDETSRRAIEAKVGRPMTRKSAG
ncbi:MAG: DUF2249 domain-containing protein [Bdellovibrionales bacterium]|nr:DUF2249 domain-containing protein [Bdellovibrionales bacterium]